MVVERALELPHDEGLPRSERDRPPGIERCLFDQILDEGNAAHPAVDSLAQLRIERDGSFQEQQRGCLVTEAAGGNERFVDHSQIVAMLGERRANRVYLVERGKKLQRARKKVLLPKQLQQSDSA